MVDSLNHKRPPTPTQTPTQTPNQDFPVLPAPHAISNENHAIPTPTRPHFKSFNLVIENNGSTARDHLANERTLLAYLRTSLAVASAGVALVQLFTIASNSPQTGAAFDRRFARPLGAVTVAIGLIILTIGVTRYFTVQLALIKGKFPVGRLTVAGIGGCLVAIIIVVFGILVSRR
ncbi:hypothetical protein C8J56DRAFT_817173 [Mycena floridula]|nr:hypothetical protein C8J56DRAFT_817173 [Mycena floridula]